MKEADIRRYAALMNELDLTGMEINENEGTVRLERAAGHNDRNSAAGSKLRMKTAQEEAFRSEAMLKPEADNDYESETSELSAAENASITEANDFNTQLDANECHSVVSPTVGIFYAAPAENAEAFVKVGDRVKKGTVLCIIEAMKLMNEVTAEDDGIIEAVLAKNGQVVEYGTKLFSIGKGV